MSVAIPMIFLLIDRQITCKPSGALEWIVTIHSAAGAAAVLPKAARDIWRAEVDNGCAALLWLAR